MGVGADLAPGTVLAAYRGGCFPMPLAETPAMAWWSPLHRGVLRPPRLRVSRSLRRSRRRYVTTVDSDFAAVVAACADPGRPGAWISQPIQEAYAELHRLGWAHSVEVWSPSGELAGGLYGVAVGGLFAGESMVSLRRDASKVALVELVELLSDESVGDRLIDMQWLTPHLASLGAEELPRDVYLRRLPALLAVPLPQPWR